MTHDEFCPERHLPESERCDIAYCLWCATLREARADERRIHGIPEPEISARDLALTDVYGDKLGRLIGQARHAL